MLFFFFNDTATTEIYTLSLHDALPICHALRLGAGPRAGGARGHRADGADGDERAAHAHRARADRAGAAGAGPPPLRLLRDRKSTRLNSSHANISYAVFCLKKKKTKT